MTVGAGSLSTARSQCSPGIAMTGDSEVRESVQEIRTNGIRDAIDDHHDWDVTTWYMVRFRLEETFGSSNREGS